jgi:hypothetical protein
VPGIGTTGWVDLGGYAKSISVTTDGAGLPAIFCIMSDNSVHVNEQNANGSWTGWIYFGASTGFQSISAATSPTNTAEVFAIGFDNAVYTLSQNPDNTWTGWTNLGGSVTQISATSVPNFGTAVFAIGAYNQTFVNELSNVGWSGWTDLGGQVKQIAAASSSYDNPEVFAIGMDNAVYVQSEANNTTWSGWTDLGGSAKSIVTQPFALSTVYAIDASNNIAVDTYHFRGADSGGGG